MSHVTHVNESWARVTCKWVTAHTRTSHDTHMTQLSITSNMWLCRVTCMHESCHTCSFSHTLKSWHTWLTFLCRICMTWQFTCVTRTLHICDMTLSHVRHDSFTCATWLIAMCGMAYSRVWHDSFAQRPWDPCAFMCCSVLQCVAVCCSVLQCVAVCCSVLWCVAVCCGVLLYNAVCSFTCLTRMSVTWIFGVTNDIFELSEVHGLWVVWEYALVRLLYVGVVEFWVVY